MRLAFPLILVVNFVATGIGIACNNLTYSSNVCNLYEILVALQKHLFIIVDIKVCSKNLFGVAVSNSSTTSEDSPCSLDLTA